LRDKESLVAESDEVFDALASYFSVLSEPTRLKIMHAICQEEKGVTQIVKEVGATQTNISRHLGLMHRSGVVTRRKEGNVVLYRVADSTMVDVCRMVCAQIAGKINRSQPLRKDLLGFIPKPGRKKSA
jgi:DNA-binding transcriptional ArsR family regulator